VCDSIVEPAIGRDLLALQPVRKPALLRQVFAIAVGQPAEIVSLQKISGQLQERGALETVSHYLQLLEDAWLVAALPKYANRIARRRRAPPKLVPLSNALLSAIRQDEPPTPELAPKEWGRWVENACLAMAWNRGQSVFYWREEPLEVDLVSTGSWGNWAVEIKAGTARLGDIKGVLEFARRNTEFRPAVVCRPDDVRLFEATGVTVVGWPEFLMEGMAGR
jgi:hypothetical protein